MDPIMNTDDAHLKRFLDRFPANRRSYISAFFHRAVRTGSTDVEQILETVSMDASQRSRELRSDPDRRDLLIYLIQAIHVHRIEAELFADHVLNWNQLPDEERARRKQERGEVHRQECMRCKPPTPKQIDLLRSLGCRNPPTNRWDASELIDRLLKRRGMG